MLTVSFQTHTVARRSRKISRDTYVVVNATETNQEHSKERWLRDEVLLEAEHERDPRNSRTVFYLAQTYDLNNKPLKGMGLKCSTATLHLVAIAALTVPRLKNVFAQTKQC